MTDFLYSDNPDEYIVAVLLQPIKDEDRFVGWPAHITVVPWFEVEKGELAIAALQRVAVITRPFSAVVGGEANFGPRGGVKVNHVICPGLKEAHELMIREIENLGGGAATPQYILTSYRPHITKKIGYAVNKNDQFRIDKLWLIRANKNEPRLTRLKKVVVEVELFK